mmetsp:Transcript_22285/g.56492  ORF Transcript_22285/g.56492 Transcript_22285/m.56492 type:complete len:370 (-) Transcript_22285:228-1337(-)
MSLSAAQNAQDILRARQAGAIEELPRLAIDHHHVVRAVREGLGAQVGVDLAYHAPVDDGAKDHLRAEQPGALEPRVRAQVNLPAGGDAAVPALQPEPRARLVRVAARDSGVHKLDEGRGRGRAAFRPRVRHERAALASAHEGEVVPDEQDQRVGQRARAQNQARPAAGTVAFDALPALHVVAAACLVLGEGQLLPLLARARLGRRKLHSPLVGPRPAHADEVPVGCVVARAHERQTRLGRQCVSAEDVLPREEAELLTGECTQRARVLETGARRGHTQVDEHRPRLHVEHALVRVRSLLAVIGKERPAPRADETVACAPIREPPAELCVRRAAQEMEVRELARLKREPALCRVQLLRTPAASQDAGLLC